MPLTGKRFSLVGRVLPDVGQRDWLAVGLWPTWAFSPQFIRGHWAWAIPSWRKERIWQSSWSNKCGVGWRRCRPTNGREQGQCQAQAEGQNDEQTVDFHFFPPGLISGESRKVHILARILNDAQTTSVYCKERLKIKRSFVYFWCSTSYCLNTNGK